MGCGASSQKATQVETQENAQSGEVTTWATKTDVRKDIKDGSTSQSDGGAVASKGGAVKNDQLRVMDPDDESEIEIIYEGKKQSPKQHNAANAQEAPDAIPEAAEMPETEANRSAASKPQPELSQRQKDEAEKMAAMRNRFEHQRFGGPGATATSGQSPSAVASGPSVMNASAGQASAVPAIGIQDPHRAADGIMGLNGGNRSEDPMSLMFDDALPGGIAFDSTPRADPPKTTVKKNKHFDDDDELLMEEILADVNDI